MDEKISESTDNGRVDSILMLDDVILCGWPLFSQINKGSNVMVKKTFSLSFCTYKPDLNSFTTPKKTLIDIACNFLQILLVQIVSNNCYSVSLCECYFFMIDIVIFFGKLYPILLLFLIFQTFYHYCRYVIKILFFEIMAL